MSALKERGILPDRTAAAPGRRAWSRPVTFILLAAVLILTVMVRQPAYTRAGAAAAADPDTVRDREGVPYYAELDGYYHARMADEIAKKGVFGTSLVSGERWDFQSFAPEGRSADYQAGIVYMAVGLWRFLRLFGDISLHWVDYYISCLFAGPVNIQQ